MYHFHPAILAVSRQINQEAGRTLRENLFVKIETEYVGGTKLYGLPIVAEDDSASRVTYCASELTLVWYPETCDSGPLFYMFAGDDMTIFCRILSRSDLFGRSLSIAITGIAPTTTRILQLLEPFRRLHSMASVRITGQIDVEYKLDLIAKFQRKDQKLTPLSKRCRMPSKKATRPQALVISQQLSQDTKELGKILTIIVQSLGHRRLFSRGADSVDKLITQPSFKSGLL